MDIKEFRKGIRALREEGEQTAKELLAIHDKKKKAYRENNPIVIGRAPKKPTKADRESAKDKARNYRSLGEAVLREKRAYSSSGPMGVVSKRKSGEKEGQTVDADGNVSISKGNATLSTPQKSPATWSKVRARDTLKRLKAKRAKNAKEVSEARVIKRKDKSGEKFEKGESGYKERVSGKAGHSKPETASPTKRETKGSYKSRRASRLPVTVDTTVPPGKFRVGTNYKMQTAGDSRQKPNRHQRKRALGEAFSTLLEVDGKDIGGRFHGDGPRGRGGAEAKLVKGRHAGDPETVKGKIHKLKSKLVTKKVLKKKDKKKD